VRKEDITINNTVLSASLAEARLGLDGFGVIGEKQRPGWLARVLDWIFPL
jgi:flagellar L-ring protein precursor FlgH